MPTETFSWAGQTVGADQQVADLSGSTYTSNVGSGTVDVTVKLLPAGDINSDGDYNPADDTTVANVGEAYTGEIYVGTGTYDTSGLYLSNRNDNGGSTVSGVGTTHSTTVDMSFASNAGLDNAVENLSFWLNDIDMHNQHYIFGGNVYDLPDNANDWQDQIQILAYDVNGVLLPASAITFSNVGSSIDVDLATGTLTANDNADIDNNNGQLTDTDPAGAVQVTISAAVSHVSIVYNNLKTGNQFVGVSDLTFDPSGVPACFTSGTMIRTPKGEVAIDELCVGDEVSTLDHGAQKILWIGKTKIKPTGDLAPIYIAKGALGNHRELLVSPEHRMLLTDPKISILFDHEAMLASAKSLVDGVNIYEKSVGEVTYFHLMFDQHEIVFAEGAPSESFYLEAGSASGLVNDVKKELLALFPSLMTEIGQGFSPARPVLAPYEATLLAS